MQKVFRRALTALLIVTCVLTAAIVGATVKLYTATGEDYANEVESQDIAKLRARDKAIKNATKQAGVYLRSYSRSVNSELTDDDILAITSNAWQLVGEPKYTRTVNKISDETTIIVWTAFVEVNVDDAEIQSWLKLDDKDKSTIISQTRSANEVSDENERQIKNLREKYNRATSQAEKDSIIQQMNNVDRNFLANQKFEEANKLYYAKNYNGAVKLYNETIELKPYYHDAYMYLGWAYYDLKQYDQSIKTLNKLIQIHSYSGRAYYLRGINYIALNQYEKALQDLDKALKLIHGYFEADVMYGSIIEYQKAAKEVQLNPNSSKAYYNRGFSYSMLWQYELAIKDFDKAIELEPNNEHFYFQRGSAYYELKQYEQAIQDFDKAIKLNPNYASAYYGRGRIYFDLKQYEQAFQDFNKEKEIENTLKIKKHK